MQKAIIEQDNNKNIIVGDYSIFQIRKRRFEQQNLVLKVQVKSVFGCKGNTSGF